MVIIMSRWWWCWWWRCWWRCGSWWWSCWWRFLKLRPLPLPQLHPPLQVSLQLPSFSQLYPLQPFWGVLCMIFNEWCLFYSLWWHYWIDLAETSQAPFVEKSYVGKCLWWKEASNCKVNQQMERPGNLCGCVPNLNFDCCAVFVWLGWERNCVFLEIGWWNIIRCKIPIFQELFQSRI